ncbi:MAG: phospho-sugar mutase [Acidimicrobiia bacterium]
MSDLISRVEEWITGDPDPVTRRELRQLIERGDADELQKRFSGTLEFGTAGIRGVVGAGPTRMNRAVVIRTTSGLADYLLEEYQGPPTRAVVVGYDARPDSRRFAEDTAGVLAAAGIPVVYFPEEAPTPLVAFTAKHLHAAAAVVITASHNPPEYNGYKVYGSNSAQIIPPTDSRISAAIARVGAAAAVPRLEGVFSGGSDLAVPVPERVFDCYWEEVSQQRRRTAGSDLRIVYTPLHGVGGGTVVEMFERAGHEGLVPVARQFEPDGAFPTVAFPNPEEPGALDLAIAEAGDADLMLANDPDADRLAVALPHEGGWSLLNGNEIGVLLGDYLTRDLTVRPIVVNSIVSSPMLGLIVAARGGLHEVTLTGFKWIVNAGLSLQEAGEGRFVFGYEEALGYTVDGVVRDKDGMSAALILADLAADLADVGHTLWTRLVELWQEFGLWASAQHSVTRAGPEGMATLVEAVDRLAADPPAVVGEWSVSSVVDYREDAAERPPWLGIQALVQLDLEDGGRLLVRPSGTEPKLKIYADLRGTVGERPLEDRDRLTAHALDLARRLADELGL